MIFGKKYFLVLASLGALFIAMVFVFLFYKFLTTTNREIDEQKRYLEKSVFVLQGKVKDYKHLGGINTLIEIEVTHFKSERNLLGKKDQFSGIYCPEENTAYMIVIASENNDINTNFNKTSLPYVNANSSRGTIIYNVSGMRDTVSLRPASVYTHHLIDLDKEKANCLRF
ncbi:hypothetical protein ACJD0Z_04125 [Flavobacteriaceae bacterium M23B6Z8]